MYAPWRHDYVTRKTKRKDKKEMVNECVFCDQLAEEKDEEHFILKRFPLCFVVMNHYPYNAGHIMVLPYKHTGFLHELTPDVRAAMMEATNISGQIIEKVTKCEGLNVGINIGAAGGGGIREHLHIHILPRWMSDTNFLGTLADTTLICTDMQEVYRELKIEFDKI